MEKITVDGAVREVIGRDQKGRPVTRFIEMAVHDSDEPATEEKNSVSKAKSKTERRRTTKKTEGE